MKRAAIPDPDLSALETRRLLVLLARLPAEKRIQRPTIKPQVASPQMLEQSPARKRPDRTRLLRVQNAERVVDVHPGAHPALAVRILHRPAKSPAQRRLRNALKIVGVGRVALIRNAGARRKFGGSRRRLELFCVFSENTRRPVIQLPHNVR